MNIFIVLSMRLWSVHPKYLDAKGLVALWREALLAQNVLLGLTKGYKNHPQLSRFKETSSPSEFIGSFLLFVHEEAQARGYNFDKSKIKNKLSGMQKILVTDSQLNYEFQHLKRKLIVRDHKRYTQIKSVKKVQLHPIFKKVKGGIADWEII